MILMCPKCHELASCDGIGLLLPDANSFECSLCDDVFTLDELRGWMETTHAAIVNWKSILEWVKKCPSRTE